MKSVVVAYRVLLLAFMIEFLFASTHGQEGPIATTTPRSTPPISSEVSSTSKSSGDISGHVLTDGGKPVPGARITLRQIGTTATHSTTSDQTGSFVVDGLPIGLYRISVFAPGYVVLNAATDTDLYQVGSSLSIVVTKGGVITGRIVNSEGRPAAGVSVRAMRVRDIEGKGVSGSFSQERLSDDRGIYRIYGLEAGMYQVLAGGASLTNASRNVYQYDSPSFFPSGIRDGATEIAVQAGMEVGGIDFTYRGERGHSIKGTISAGLSKQPVSIFLTLERIGAPAIDYFSAKQMDSDHNSFSIYGIPDGDYLLTARARSELVDAFAERSVKIKGDDLTNLNLTLIKLGSLSGRIEIAADAEPCRRDLDIQPATIGVKTQRISPVDKVVSLSPFASGQSFTAIGSDRSLLLTGLREGVYRITPELPNAGFYVQAIRVAQDSSTGTKKPPFDAAKDGVNLKAGEAFKDIVITIAGGAAALEGQVVKPNEDPGNSIRVVIAPAERDQKDNVLRYGETSISNQGTFTFNNIAPGRYFVMTVKPGNKDTGEPRPLAWDPEFRANLRRQAERQGTPVELKKCQRVTDYEVTLR